MLPTLFLALLLLALHPLSEVRAFAPPANFFAAADRSCSSKLSSYLDDETNNTNRKVFLQTMLTTAAAAVVTSVQPANAATTSAASFLGTYSDPINHPGGTRTITLIDGASNGDYQLAQIKGGGGRGEPTEYQLPAVIFGDRAIVIDFSPKGGPRDFAGVLQSDGSIRFLRDGNVWPRL